MSIQLIVSTFPEFARRWAEIRLNRFFRKTRSLPSDDVLISVKDYLSSLTPEDRIYQKLNKVSWKDAVHLQGKWHDAIARKSAKLTEFGGDAEAEIFIDCGNGYRWIELKTPEQLDFEGDAMGHCIGKGSYDESKDRLFSLRDKDNLPHVTIELDQEEHRYIQIRGRANKPVIADYWEDTVKLFSVLGFENGPNKFAGDRNYICTVSSIYFEAEDIERIIKDDSAFIESAGIKDVSFGITAEGKFLYLNEPPHESMSFKMAVLRSDSNIKTWEWDVSGKFYAYETLLEAIAEHVKFGGNVGINRTRVKHWHNDVAGDFSAHGSLLETISSNVKFGRNVYIGRTNVKHWHSDVPGNFYAYGSALKTVSIRVKFGKNVVIRGTNVSHWHNDVPGDFDAYETLLETVSDDVKFGGNVNIRETKVKCWHNDVSGSFSAYGSALETVSAHVKFGGNVNIRGTNVSRWHNDVPGDFNAYGTPLEAIAENVRFGGKVNVCGTKVEASFMPTSSPTSNVVTPGRS